jgi:ABC-type dipeptide/oligopeptide/nickel transport system ATPase component
MEVRLEKIIETMSVLNVTADHLIKTHGEDHVAVMLAGECIKSAAALRAAMHMSELESAQVTGELQ